MYFEYFKYLCRGQPKFGRFFFTLFSVAVVQEVLRFIITTTLVLPNRRPNKFGGRESKKYRMDMGGEGPVVCQTNSVSLLVIIGE